MRKLFFIFVLILMTGMIIPAAGSTEEDTPRIILYTYYRQMGWGDRVQIGCVDEDGVIRTLTGSDSDLKWPYKPEEQLEYLSQTDKLTAEGTMEHNDLFSVKSLVYSVEDQGSKTVPAANDAGTEKSYAVRYSEDGTPEFILLGVSGDDVFENFDPNAQSLYRTLRLRFPGVTSYAYDSLGIGPHGFDPVPVADFIGLDILAASAAEIKGGLIDCEEGYIPQEMTEDDKAELLSFIKNGIVTGKADCVISTGGMYSYAFYDSEEKLIGTIDLEDGLLIKGDGHYYIDFK